RRLRDDEEGPRLAGQAAQDAWRDVALLVVYAWQLLLVDPPDGCRYDRVSVPMATGDEGIPTVDDLLAPQALRRADVEDEQDADDEHEEREGDAPGTEVDQPGETDQ